MLDQAPSECDHLLLDIFSTVGLSVDAITSLQFEQGLHQFNPDGLPILLLNKYLIWMLIQNVDDLTHSSVELLDVGALL